MTEEGDKMALPDMEIANLIGTMVAPDLNKNYEDPNMYVQDGESNCQNGILECCGNISKSCCLPCSPCGCGPLMRIQQGEIGLLLNKGKLKAKLGPGLHTFNTCIEELIRVSLKTTIVDMPVQQLLTKDNVTILLNGYIAYNISIPEYAIFRINDIPSLLTQLTMGTFKSLLATKTLDQILTERRDIEDYVTRCIDEKTDYYGIKVTAVDTMSMDLPKQLENALVTAALSERKSKAKIITAKGQLESAKLVRDSAIELSKNKVSLQLQYFEVLKKAAEIQEVKTRAGPIKKMKPARLLMPYFLSEDI